MKRHNNYLSGIFILLLLIAIACTSDKSDQREYGKATLKLIDLVDSNPEVKALLEASIAKAKEVNPDMETNPVQTLEAYYDFVSWGETSMPWALLKKTQFPDMYNNILQSICYFYFLNEQPLAALEGKGLFNNSIQYAEPYSAWLRTFSKSWGKYLDSEASWNEEYLQMALNDEKFGLQNDWYEDPSNWKTFNQFFGRHLRSPNARPISSPNDNSVVVAFADSEPMGTWQIDENSFIVDKVGVPVKSMTLNSIEKLIGADSEFKSAFAGGTFTHSFLNVNDYHRYHFPLGGVIKEVRIIPGQNVSGALIFWDTENHRYAFDPSLVGWQSVETRGCVILDTEGFGLVALMPIGMVQVSSVNFEDNVKVGARVNKGDMLGSFLFGGSDFILLFQKDAGFVLDAPMQEDESSYRHMLVGERLGQLAGAAK